MKREAGNHSPASPCAQASRARVRSNEQGWALLGLLLAMTVMSIFLVSSITPNVKVQIQREKENEMRYRGEQMAKAIARYYNGGRLGPIILQARPPYGYLTELKKLRDGVTIGVREIRFARASEMIDPLVSDEWEPVRARDPRIMKVLQSYAAETNAIIPQSYLLLAGPPQKLQSFSSAFPSDSTKPQGSTTPSPGKPGQVAPPKPKSEALDDDDNDDDEEEDDDDDDDDANDPLKHLFGGSGFGGSDSGPGRSNIPIVGVAPKMKGSALKPLYGLTEYDEWVFIYIPDFSQVRPGVQPQNPGINNRNGPRISQ